MALWSVPRVIKRCPKGHRMELRAAVCPVCHPGSGGSFESRSDLTIVAAPAAVVVPEEVIGRLLIVAGRNEGKEIWIRAGRTILGRSPSAEDGAAIVSLEDEFLTKRHLSIVAGIGGLVLVDLGSTNGTEVNGATVERAVLQPGDEIHAGQTTLRLLPNARP